MSQSGEDPILRQAIELHQRGQFHEAEKLYRNVLSINPTHVDALHFLGVLAGQFNQHDAAIELIQRAIDLRADNSEARFNLATNLAAAGRIDDAIVEFQKVVLARPDDADAHLLIADLMRRAARKDEAIAHLRRTLELREANADAHNNLGNLLQERGQLDDAIVCFNRSLALRPGNAQTLNNLGNALRQKGDFNAAANMLRQALAAQPDSPQIRTNLANVLNDRGEIDAAIAEYRTALIHSPAYPEGWNHLGIALREAGRLDEALTAHRRAISLRPDYPEARYAEAWSLLLRGDFEDGWPAYESRPRAGPEWARFENPWMGDPLEGRKILLHAEQGFGDTIQFARFAATLAAMGGRVILECQRELLSLLEGLAGIEQLVARDDDLPEFDVHCPLMSVPFVLKTTAHSIPANVPYIDADPLAVAQWAGRLKHNQDRHVGLVWAGRRTYSNDRNRSMRLSNLAPLAQVQGVTFHSLQTGEAGAEVLDHHIGLHVIDHRNELNDFAQTAALIANLDLVISVDTAVAHLAGAMARPVWTMLPFAPDWRWMLDRPDSPWYPTMRLFRQTERGNWGQVAGRLAEALATF